MTDKNKKDSSRVETSEAVEQQPEAEAPETIEAAQDDAVTQLEEALRDKEDKYLRVCAEYDNFRKRSQKEREGIYSLAQAEVVGSFIPVLDNMERACAAEGADEGVKMILKQMTGVLERYGVAAVGATGETFDPNLHNAVSHEGDGGAEESVISEVLQKGYTLGDKLIRPAMVKTRS